MKSQITTGKQNCPQIMTELGLKISFVQSMFPFNLSYIVIVLLFVCLCLPEPTRARFPNKLINLDLSGMKREDGFLANQSQNQKYHQMHRKRRLPYPSRELGIEVTVGTPIM